MDFILFAHARSGSTSLARSLDLHPELNVAIEPFHPDYGRWNPDERPYIETITDHASLHQALHELFSRYNGIKILDYQLPEEIYDHMLQLPEYKIILLKRRNLLQTIVSGLIAEQTGVWQIDDMNPERRRIYENLAPLSVEEIGRKLDFAAQWGSHYAEVVARRPADSRLFVDYEDLYTPDLNKNRAELARVFAFLSLTIPADGRIDELLDPRRTKINSAHIYRTIPNGEEIEARFGSEETGHLIERAGRG